MKQNLGLVRIENDFSDKTSQFDEIKELNNIF